MLRLLLASAVTCACLTPVLAEETAPAPQVVIVPGDVAQPTELPRSMATDEAAISAPETATSESSGGCRRHGSTVYLTN